MARTVVLNPSNWYRHEPHWSGYAVMKLVHELPPRPQIYSGVDLLSLDLTHVEPSRD